MITLTHHLTTVWLDVRVSSLIILMILSCYIDCQVADPLLAAVFGSLSSKRESLNEGTAPSFDNLHSETIEQLLCSYIAM